VSYYNRYLRVLESKIEADSVTGEHIFNLDEFAPRNNQVEYFYFVNSSGNKVSPTAGSVTITMSSGEDIYNTISDGTFNAADAMSENRPKPNAHGKVAKAKITFTNVSGNGVAGFRGLIAQAVA